ncbi:MAG TPA: branched-chain amino acid ABC transporter permease [Streptosporangiaceae bacterium]|nr:branched-chain amino acid ABC transporter permease [Streptosporangiaceae bacterium]
MTILWAGLSVGAIYTLVALGYNIPLAQTGIFNFAQGQIVVFGTFFAWFVMGDHGWPWWVAIVGGAAAGGLIAAVEELLAIRPVVAKGSHALLVTTVGAAVIIEGVLLATWGSTTRSVNFFAGNNAFSLLGGRLLPVDLWLIVTAVVISFGLHAVSRYTLWGLAGRAATDDMGAAVVRGVNVTRLRMSAFVLAGAMGAALGPLIGPVAGIDVSTGITLTIYGFVALALGGFGSFPGCLFGGMAIGLVEAYASRYFGVAYPPLILFGILILLLLLKPAGLFGQRGLRVV